MCFSDEEVITVGSSAYNLAGDVASRDNFMKNNVLSMIFSGISKRGLGKGIVDAHIAGPATLYTRFYKWAESSGYNAQVGNSGGLVYNSNSITPEAFAFLVPEKITHDQRAISFTTSALDLKLAALEWIINNDPTKRDTSFTVVTSGDDLTITYSGTTTTTFTSGYNLTNNMPLVYLYHEERLKLSEVVTDTGWVTGTPPVLLDFTGSSTSIPEIVQEDKVTTTVTTYSDSTPTSTVVTLETQDLGFDKVTAEYTTVTTIVATPTVEGIITTLVQNEESFYNVVFTTTVSSSFEVISGVTVTTTITIDTPSLEVYWQYKQVSTEVTQEKWLPYLLKLYQKGTSVEGDTLLFGSPTTIQNFFPVIPLRRDNVMVDSISYPTQYGWNRKAARKCFGSKKKYDDLIDSLADNPSLADIDHAWVVFGVSLSTKQQDGQKYLYEFFKNLSDNTVSSVGVYKSPTDFETAWAAFKYLVSTSSNDESGITLADRPTPPEVQKYTVTVSASSALLDWLYNISITCKGGNQVVGSGYNARSSNKVGYCWVYEKGSVTLSVPTPDDEGRISYVPTSTAIIAFGKQESESTWVEYEFFDLVHTNNVYQGITTTTLGTTVIASTDENSSFLVPLHEGVFTELTLVRRTQLSMECAFIVVNYYDKQTIPWYATGFFQIVIVVVLIVIAVNTGYIDGGAAGLLGENVYVGISLGFTGTAAIVAGAIANAVAAAIVSALITKVAVSALGEEVGRIVGLLASMITIQLMSSQGPFSLADSWAQMTKADNLIKFTMGGVGEYGNYLQGQAMKVNAETQALIAETTEAMKEINRLTQELLSDTGVNVTTITDAIRYATETSAQFLNRTTMTGTEIAEISIKLVEDFPAPQLALPYLET